MKRFLQKRNDRRVNDQLQAQNDLAYCIIETNGLSQPHPEYSYKPIKEDGYIRLFLLRTEHGAVDRQVRGQLVVKPLKAVEDDYVAISYVWGKEVLSKKIVIEQDDDEFEIMITENLYAALTEVAVVWKKIRKNMFVWADGICINQKDKHDKTQQVSLMKHIYSSAHAVLVHFGLSRDELDAVAKATTHLERELVKHRFKEWVFRRPVDVKHFFLSPGSLERRAMEKVWEHAWWRRCWTLEEAVLAKNLTFTIGRDLHNLRDLTRQTLEIVRIHAGGPKELTPSTLKRLAYVCDESVKNEQPSLIQLMWDTRYVEVYDERDLLFSLLGIAKEGNSAELAPNYKESLDKTRLRFAKFLIRNGDGRDLLHLCFDKDEAGRLPSWIPQKLESCHSEEGMRVQDLPPAKRRSSSVHIVDDARNILWVEGFRVGVIADLGQQTEVGRTRGVHVGRGTKLRKIEAWARDLQTLVSPMRGHPFLESQCSCHRSLGDAHLLRILLTQDKLFWPESKMDWVYNDNELEDFHKFLLWCWEALEKPDASVSYSATKKQKALLLRRVEAFYGLAMTCCRSKRLCRTENNMLGLVDSTARARYFLFSLDRRNVLVLRPVGSVGKYDECYRIIGAATLYHSKCWPLKIKKEMEPIYVV